MRESLENLFRKVHLTSQEVEDARANVARYLEYHSCNGYNAPIVLNMKLHPEQQQGPLAKKQKRRPRSKAKQTPRSRSKTKQRKKSK